MTTGTVELEGFTVTIRSARAFSISGDGKFMSLSKTERHRLRDRAIELLNPGGSTATAQPERRGPRAFIAHPQRPGERDCLRRALACPLQVSPETLPRPNFRADDWLLDYNERLEREAGVTLEWKPETWRPVGIDEVWIACLRNFLDDERGQAVAVLHGAVLFDADDPDATILPRHKLLFGLRVHRLAA